MKIWLSKNSEVPVREQIVTQITLGIASGDLAVGMRLPSTSEMARRYKIHSNTVSHAYQLLAEQGWLEFKKGSGFYVRESNSENLENSLDKLIAQFVAAAQTQGFSAEEIKTRLLKFLDSQKSNELFVIEDDEALREILIEEISGTAKFEVKGVSFEEFEQNLLKTDANFSAMFDERAKISAVLPSDKNCVFLKARSAAASMTGETRPTPDDLIAVVSGWKNFLILAKTMLVAVKIEPESLIIRSTGEENWRKGLNAASMIICDSVTAKNLSDFQ
ncbi:MAG TPA: GntR family transcriptional regulator, partial [Pyrinomonadaceae bacterium]|nr:GntR family transcriptional regulator [Pyrinomonadaceae bacterium]